jgi:hypothetical protein
MNNQITDTTQNSQQLNQSEDAMPNEIVIGRMNRLETVKTVDFGLYLDGGEFGEVLLPKRYVPEGSDIGSWISCFLYFDSEDRLIATTETPYVQIEQCAHLKVVAVNKIGAFVDWGLSKDLLVPYSEQAVPMIVGKRYVVYAYQDQASERIVASSKLSHYLSEVGSYFKPDQKVDLLISGRSDLGYKAVINGSHLGLIFNSDVIQTIHIGDKITGYIKSVRAGDHKIDLALRPSQTLPRDALEATILSYLAENGGVCSITDKSSPNEIYEVFRASKANYKKTIGKLYKERKISLTKTEIKLSES